MKPNLILSCLLFSITGVSAVEQVLVPWNHPWKYFHPMSDDPSLDDPTIDDTGAGVAPTTGPDLIYTNFNGTTDPVGAWFATEANFTSPTGYANVFGKGFGIDGTLTGTPAANYSTYDGGQGPGPLGYGPIVYHTRTDIVPEMTAHGTTLTLTPANRKWAAYFRTTFAVAQDFSKPRLRMLLDDSAIIYYDGVLIARVNRDNNTLGYADTGVSDTAATNNEEGLTGTAVPPAPNNGNENTIQSFFLDQAGGPGRATLTPGARADSFVVTTLPKITAGTHTLAVIVRNSGGDSSDMEFGFQLLGDDAGISAAAGAAVRNFMGTANPDDDTFSVPVTVTKLGSTAISWTSNDIGNPAGSFGVATTFGPYPVSSAVTVNFTSVGHTPPPELTTSITLNPPFLLGMNSLTPSPTAITFPPSPPWTEVVGRPFLQLNNSGALSVQDTDPIALTPGTPKCITIAMEYNDSSTGSNAETGDSIKVELVTDAGTVNLTAEHDLDGTSTNNGRAMNGEDDPLLTSSDELNPDSLPEPYTFTARWLLAGIIPSNATTVLVRFSGMNDSGTEILRVGNIQLKACVDTDGDGMLDIFEEVQGTNPNDGNSVFREVSHSSTPGSASITVTTSTTRTYAFESSTDLVTWTRDALPGTPPALPFLANEPGTGGNLTLTRTNANPARLFWRAKVHLPTTDIVSP